jgi:hypothetical protein
MGETERSCSVFFFVQLGAAASGSDGEGGILNQTFVANIKRFAPD